MTKERTTKKQQLLLQFIGDFIREHGYGPSYREIMNGLEYKSVSTVAIHVDGLIARGWLRKQNHSARSLEIVSQAGVTEAQLKGQSLRTHIVPQPVVGDQIAKKCDELLATTDTPLTDISSLVESLRLLGYEDLYGTYSVKRDQYQQNEV